MAEADHTVRRMAPGRIEGLVFGVRYEPQLKLLDTAGTVLDEILHAEGSPFDTDMFPFSEPGPLQYTLINNETGAKIGINAQDTILQMPVSTNDASQVNDLGRDFDNYVLTPLKKIGKLKNIVRYGVLLQFKEHKIVPENSPIARYLSADFPKANSLIMRFTRRIPIEEALAMKSVEDYRNAIYSIAQPENSKMKVSIDFQEYFQPMLSADDWKSKPFSAFVDRGTDYVEGEFQKWFKKFLAISEGAA